MTIRSIKEHIREQNWFAVWLDLVIVFLAVFIGLQADNWNEERIASKTAKTYYTRLIVDLQAEQTSRQARVLYYEQTKRHAGAALDAMRLSAQPLDMDFLVDAYQSTQRWNYTPQRTTYDELIGTGIAHAIPSVEVRTRLANFYVGLSQSSLTQQESTPFRDRLRREMPHKVQSEIRESCDDKYHVLENGMFYLELPEVCNVELESSLVEEAIRELRAYDGFSKDLTQHIAIIDAKLNSLRGTELRIREMVELLSAQ